ncbi:MAG: glycine cleavage system protein GcvH [Desulfobacterales bacterium]|nr:glycine cleavage system protein GcvH [Desulfobacterales bacterium]
MKEINQLNLPENVGFTEDHEWARKEGGTIRVGIDDYAQDQLGDVVFVELPQVGDKFAKGDAFGSVESVKAVSELFMPMGGEISAINEDLEESPELVNTSPYDKGWMIDVKPDDPKQLDAMMPRDAYLELLKGL